MIFGQGSPQASMVRRCAAARLVALWSRWLIGVAVLLPALAAGDESIRVRIEWGGGVEKRWEGKISLSQGAPADPACLGIEADEAGSMWVEGEALVVRQRSSRTYDGVDLSIPATPDTQVVVQLAPAGAASPSPLRITVADLMNEHYAGPLDHEGNRLLVRRAPGDRLRVHLESPSLVFNPGERLQFDLQPHFLAVPADTRLRIGLQLSEARGSTALWSAEHNLRMGNPQRLPITVPLPEQEGVFDLSITATPVGWQHAMRMPLGTKAVAERKLQVVVLKTTSSPGGAAGELVRVAEIDPANPRWWERLGKLPHLPALPRLRRAPLGSGSLQGRNHSLGSVAQLAPSTSEEEVSWEAYWLPLNRPGKPHVLEVDYPSNAPQMLGISILEPNAAGVFTSAGLDTGVEVPQAAASTGPHWARHRLVFWPRTRSPLLLVTNRSMKSPAVYGKIRLWAGWEELPPTAAPSARSQRLFAAYLDRPWFARNFGSTEALDGWSGRSLDDWSTFYDGAIRLADYLHYAGYDALLVSVLADGSTLYPSSVVASTPRYDTGVFFDSGQDARPKDVLRLLLRLFEREHLQLVPALEFAAPLPALEAKIRAGGAEAVGLQPIGPDGTAWNPARAARRGLGPYYNLLDPRVQAAMLEAIREVVRNYAAMPAFGGLAIHLSAEGYSQLLGPEWGVDDATIARFEKDSGLKVPGVKEQRFAQRTRFLTEGEPRKAWLQWRADQVTRFYRTVQTELSGVRRGTRLYLAGAHMFESPEWRYELRPTLPRTATYADLLLQLGIDARQYQAESGVVLLRSDELVPGGRLNTQATQLELRQMPDVDRLFGEMPTAGSLFFHPPQRIHLASFDEKGPFRASYTELATQFVPSERANRQRFVHHLATSDPRIIFDGGTFLPFGQEESIRDLVEIYRRLPAVRFWVLQTPSGESTQPVTVRWCHHGQKTWLYAANDASSPASLRVRIEASPNCLMEDLNQAGGRPLDRDSQGAYWMVELKAHDLAAVSLSDPAARPIQPSLALPRDLETELAQRVRNLVARTALLGSVPPRPLLRNPGFEAVATSDSPLPGWYATRLPGVTATREFQEKHSGNASMRFASTGPAAAVVSEVFEPPATGRLFMSVWLRLPEGAPQPALRLALDGKLGTDNYYRYAPVGRLAPDGEPATPLTAHWARYVFQVPDLPLERLSQVRVRFDLLGKGEIWIDDVQLFDLDFTRSERLELSKMATLAEVKLQSGQFGDCLRLLDGYWPRFLEAYVALPASNVVSSPARPQPAERAPAAETPGERAGLLDRVRSLWPRSLR